MPRIPNTSSATRTILWGLMNRYPRWTYGYQLLELTGLQSGTLYPILRRLQGQGYLEEQWDPAQATGVPPRRLYLLNPLGLTLARERGQPPCTDMPPIDGTSTLGS